MTAGQGRERLDHLLVLRGLFTSREKARAAILAGEVQVNGEIATKAGIPVAEDVQITLTEHPRYVSRGGDKLAGAIADLGVPVRGRIALDSGASTGGFTDCLLQHGARHVAAVDVGYGQLAWSLRQDARVTVVERQNLRYLDRPTLRDLLPADVPLPDLVTLDLSFIGLGKVLPAVGGWIQPGGLVMALVKPQFEVGRGQVGKRGVVRDPALHRQALLDVAAAAADAGFLVKGVTYSKLLGPEGNREYFLLLEWPDAGQDAPSSEPAGLEKKGRGVLEGDELAAAVGAAVAAAWAELEG